jgi:mannose-6-phosphate isomerase-like protein (cupin superfamily)
MSSEKFNVYEIASKLQTYSPFDVAELDGEYVVRVARMRGIFPWHVHAKDEFFLSLKGSLTVEMGDSRIILDQGECLTVKAGLKHRPASEGDAVVLLVEHKVIRTSKADFPEVKDKL